jgi:small multidrug resistance family-3 protein
MTKMSALNFLLSFLKTFIIFVFTAIAEIIGCYLPWLVFKEDKSFLLLIPSAFSLGVFVWLLMLHPTSAGRTYAAYGGVYIAVAIVWLRVVEGVRPNLSDTIGSFVALVGMAIIMYGSRV